MRRFQSINFNCSSVNFINPQFFISIGNTDSDQAEAVTQAVASSGRANYLEAIDQWLVTSSGDDSLRNTIKTQVRNSVIVVMDQKQLYDNSICEYVTEALNNNYKKPSFFYS